MGECEKSSVVYSARLLWRTISSTRVFVSVLNVERKNVSVSTTRHPEIENQQRYQQSRDEKSWGSFENPNVVKVRRKEIKTKTKRRKKKKKEEKGPKLKCHLCKFPNLTSSPYTTITSSSPAYTLSPSPKYTDPPPSYSLSLTYLPISQSQPPDPPLRSSSLPFFKHLRRIQIIPWPAASLTTFRFNNEKERVVWRYFVEKKGGGFFKKDDEGEIWRVVLQGCESDVGIRCLGLALASNQPQSNIGIDAKKYHLAALRILATRLWRPRNWEWDREVMFLSLYLLTLFDLLKGNKKGARRWMRQGYRVLKRALALRADDDEGMKLPGCMRVVAGAFGRLDWI